MDKITTTIARGWLREIIAGRKKTEYRDLKPYWTMRLSTVKSPFHLRLINGMTKNAPEATVVVTKVARNVSMGRYEFKLGKIIDVKNWDRRKEAPST